MRARVIDCEGARGNGRRQVSSGCLARFGAAFAACNPQPPCPPLQLLVDVLRHGRVGPYAVVLHGRDEVALAEAGRRLGGALRGAGADAEGRAGGEPAAEAPVLAVGPNTHCTRLEARRRAAPTLPFV